MGRLRDCHHRTVSRNSPSLRVSAGREPKGQEVPRENPPRASNTGTGGGRRSLSRSVGILSLSFIESIWEEGGETGRALLPTCPLLPRDQKNNRKNRTSAWRAPRARREEGAKDGCRAKRGLVLD